MKDDDYRAVPEQIGEARRDAPAHSRHPAAAQLSLCRDGALSTRDGAAVRAHLKSCHRCRAVQARLSEIRRILSRRADGSMPGRIALQVDQVIIAEAVRRKGEWPPAPRRASLYS